MAAMAGPGTPAGRGAPGATPLGQGLRPRTRPAAGVGEPAAFRMVGGCAALALAGFLLFALALLAATPDVAGGFVAGQRLLLAVHLLGLAFLPPAVAGAALHVLPVLLRGAPDPRLGRAALPCLAAGPFLAVGVARHVPWLAWGAAAVEGAGLALVAAQVALLVLRAPRGKLLVASRLGVAAATAHAVLAGALGAVLLGVRWRSWAGIPHERLVGIHLHLAAAGWLTLLVVAVGRTLGPMLVLAPAWRRRRLPLEEAGLVLGLWLLIGGLAAASRPALAAGSALLVAAFARFAALTVRTLRGSRLPAAEGPGTHLALGLLFLGQAVALGCLALAGAGGTRVLVAYALLLLLGWAGGVTLGFLGRLLALSAWTWWPPGPRPRQAAFYPRGRWLGEAACFGLGAQLAGAGALAGSTGAVRAGAALLVVAALLALAGAAGTFSAAARAGR